jgi:1-acyl-sn-glycerol-3-phosphate acyltransferase
MLRAPWAAWNALQFGFTLAWTAAWISVALAAIAGGGGRPLALRMARHVWAPGLLAGAGARLRVEGADQVDWSRPYLLVANHQSVIDICALFRAVPLPLRFLLKREMAAVPFVGWYARATGMLFIARDDRRAGPRLRREAAALLARGDSLCLFPEGTRSRDGTVAPFKAGALQPAIDAGVAILPVAIEGAGAVLPPAGRFAVRPGPITVRFGAPLPVTEGDLPADRQQLARDARASVLAMLRAGSSDHG